MQIEANTAHSQTFIAALLFIMRTPHAHNFAGGALYRGMPQRGWQRPSLVALMHPARRPQPSCPHPPSPRLDHHPRYCLLRLVKPCCLQHSVLYACAGHTSAPEEFDTHTLQLLLPVQPAFFLPGAPSDGSTGAAPSGNFFMPSTGSAGQVWMTNSRRAANIAFNCTAPCTEAAVSMFIMRCVKHVTRLACLILAKASDCLVCVSRVLHASAATDRPRVRRSGHLLAVREWHQKMTMPASVARHSRLGRSRAAPLLIAASLWHMGLLLCPP